MEPALEARIERPAGREETAGGLHLASDFLRVQCFLFWRLRQMRVEHAKVVHEEPVHVFERRAEIRRARMIGRGQAGRAAQHEFAYAFGMSDGELARHPS